MPRYTNEVDHPVLVFVLVLGLLFGGMLAYDYFIGSADLRAAQEASIDR